MFMLMLKSPKIVLEVASCLGLGLGGYITSEDAVSTLRCSISDKILLLIKFQLMKAFDHQFH